jgi:hypothetical protein
VLRLTKKGREPMGLGKIVHEMYQADIEAFAAELAELEMDVEKANDS